MNGSSPLTVVAALLSAVCVSSTAAHPGGLNSEGCHNNRKTGDYHCHGGGARTRASPAASLQAHPVDHEGSGSWSYRNCAAARAAGAAPVRIGQPGYGPHLDRDGDGIGCEPYRSR